MTTIVVVKKKDTVCIAADTLTSFGSTRYPAPYKAHPDKIIRVGESATGASMHRGPRLVPIGESYVGLVGSSAHRQVLESILTESPEHARFRSRREIFESFRALHPLLKDKYFLNPKEGEKDPYESSQMDLLIANRFGIFSVNSLRDVHEHSRFWALGSGSDYALGALYACYDQKWPAKQIAETAVRAACEFDNASAGPVTAYAVKVAEK
jgi:ATP-dependent protease HslVU (ClpYQ) peptidase subunit